MLRPKRKVFPLHYILKIILLLIGHQFTDVYHMLAAEDTAPLFGSNIIKSTKPSSSLGIVRLPGNVSRIKQIEIQLYSK